MKTNTKSQKSKLDPYAEDLERWFGEEKLTLAEAATRLQQDRGLTVNQSQLSRWWAKRQMLAARDRLFESIANGTKLGGELEDAFKKNPAPTFEMIGKLLRTIAVNLAAKGQLDATMMKLAKSLISEALKISVGIFDKQKFDQEFALAKAKFEADQNDNMNAAAEWVLDKANMAVAEKIAASSMSKADQIAALRKAMFVDVDAMQNSGEVKLPQ